MGASLTREAMPEGTFPLAAPSAFLVFITKALPGEAENTLRSLRSSADAQTRLHAHLPTSSHLLSSVDKLHERISVYGRSPEGKL